MTAILIKSLTKLTLSRLEFEQTAFLRLKWLMLNLGEWILLSVSGMVTFSWTAFQLSPASRLHSAISTVTVHCIFPAAPDTRRVSWQRHRARYSRIPHRSLFSRFLPTFIRYSYGIFLVCAILLFKFFSKHLYSSPDIKIFKARDFFAESTLRIFF